MATPDFTIADVLAWARTKPADEQYNYCNSNVCALAQFAKATNRLHLVGPSGTWFLDEWPALNNAIAMGKQTFGALVERLEPIAEARSEWEAIDAYLTDIETVEA